MTARTRTRGGSATPPRPQSKKTPKPEQADSGEVDAASNAHGRRYGDTAYVLGTTVVDAPTKSAQIIADREAARRSKN